MKILSVEIANITSIEGPYTINFDDEIFSNIGLFGITGPVGAGKSSIIDAICLGLFNTTPRLERNSNNINIAYENETLSISNPSNLLRRGASAGNITVRFKGIDNQVWRTNWMIRRSRNKADGKLQSIAMTLFNETLGSEFPETRISFVLAKIKDLIGLDFKQFTKSVILAQGDFQAFLNASDNERAQILGKLTGTEIYSEISKEIYAKSEEVKNEYLSIENQINSLKLLSIDDVEILKLKVLELDQQILNLNETETNLKNDLKWFETLNDLNKSIHFKKVELETYEKQRLELISDFETLKRIDKIADIKPIFLEGKDLINQKNLLNDDLKKISFEIKNLDSENLKTKEEITFSENLKEKLSAEIKVNEPLYKKARELDIDINRIQLLISEIKNEVSLLTQNLNLEQTNFNQKKSELKTNSETLNNIENWFTTNSKIKIWTENKSLLVNRFDQLKKTFLELKNLASQYKLVNDSLIKNSEIEKNTSENLIEISSKLNTLKLEIDVEKQKIKSDNLDTIIASQNTLNQQITACNNYKLLAINYKKLSTNILNNSVEIKKGKKDFSVLKEKETKLENEIRLLKVKLQEQQIFLNKLRLESANNVQHLRSLLKPNTECPVCGSTEHQVEKVTVLNKILIDAEKDFDILENNLENLQNNFTENASKITLLNQTIQNLIKNNEQFESEILQIEMDWNSNIKLEIDINLKEDSVLNILTEYEKSILLKDKRLKNSIESFKQIQNLINLKETEEKNIQEEIQKIEISHNEIKLLVQDLNSQRNQIILNGDKLRGEETEIKNQISTILNLDNWFDVFKKNPETVTSEVFSKIENWFSYEKHQSELKQNSNLLQLEIENLKAKIEQISIVNTEKNNKIDSENKVLTSKINERNTYFNGEDIDIVESKLKLELEKVLNKIAIIYEKFNEIEKSISSKKAIEKEKSEQKTKIINSISEIEIKIDNFILGFNKENELKLSKEEIENLASISNDWILKIRNNFIEISQKISVIEGGLKLLLDQNLKHNENKPNRDINEINAELKNKAELIKLATESLIESKGVLHNQNNNLNEKTDLLNKQQKMYPDYEEWNAINSLLGSSSGDKLKKLAQQFTLDLLLQAANAQLQQINNRYILERIEDTLSIMVIDQFMANTKRGTNSLSGGETFLVSLALSLALSSVSSTQLKVESLFIDEGFGNLDPDSLETAFLALENLQNQGRTVGIISHLDSVIDRLSLKINVLPTGNGKSIINIIS